VIRGLVIRTTVALVLAWAALGWPGGVSSVQPGACRYRHLACQEIVGRVIYVHHNQPGGATVLLIAHWRPVLVHDVAASDPPGYGHMWRVDGPAGTGMQISARRSAGFSGLADLTG
jgi:hypothetical protein